MKRSEKSQKLKKKIIDVTRRLLLTQGYAKTTIRQIAKETGLTTGSLYNFYKNKDDIFLKIVIDYLDWLNDFSETISPAGTDPTVRYAIIICMQTAFADRYRSIAELVLEAYDSWRSLDAISRNSGMRNRAFFGKYNPGLSDDDYYLRSLAINGAIRNAIAERIYGDGLSMDVKVLGILNIAFFLFNIPAGKSAAALKKARELLKKNPPRVYNMSLS